MGHRAGWLALGAGLAGGADVILIPEIPYSVSSIAAAIKGRVRRGTNFSIVAVAEGARNVEDARALAAAEARADRAKDPTAREAAKGEIALLKTQHIGNTQRLAHQLEQLTGLESRLTILGYVQRGGTPSPVDRLLATRLGSAAADLVAAGTYGVMVAARGDDTKAVPLKKIAGHRKTVPPDHTWLVTARHVGTCLGD
jgi:6-phosphofructokinase